MTGARPRVAAIVPQYSEPSSSIERVLGGILSQRYAPDEVVLVDDASPAPPMIAQDLAERTRILRLARNGGVSAARNHAADQTSGDYILFTNCDVVLADDWVQRATEFMEANPAVAAVSGAIVPRIGNAVIRRWRLQHIETKVHRIDLAAPVEVQWIVGHVMFVRRIAFEEVGGFDARYRRAGDDPDLCNRLRAAGHKIYHLPTLSADSYEPATLDAMARKCVRNLGWNLREGCEPCAAVRPLRPLRAAISVSVLLADHATRDLLRRRWEFVPVDFAVAGCSLRLIWRAWSRSPAAPPIAPAPPAAA